MLARIAWKSRKSIKLWKRSEQSSYLQNFVISNRREFHDGEHAELSDLFDFTALAKAPLEISGQ